jgi:hypothetical protein
MTTELEFTTKGLGLLASSLNRRGSFETFLKQWPTVTIFLSPTKPNNLLLANPTRPTRPSVYEGTIDNTGRVLAKVAGINYMVMTYEAGPDL